MCVNAQVRECLGICTCLSRISHCVCGHVRRCVVWCKRACVLVCGLRMRDVCTGARDITLSVETVWFQLKEPEWKGRLQQLRDEATSPLPGWARRKTSLLVAPHPFFSTTVAGVRARSCRGILFGRGTQGHKAGKSHMRFTACQHVNFSDFSFGELRHFLTERYRN